MYQSHQGTRRVYHQQTPYRSNTFSLFLLCGYYKNRNNVHRHKQLWDHRPHRKNFQKFQALHFDNKIHKPQNHQWLRNTPYQNLHHHNVIL